MAAVSVPPSPQALSTMTSRRVPLASVPNATNSPYRPTAATATKRPRSHATEQREAAYAGQPPAKKLLIEEHDTESRRQALLKKVGYGQSAAVQKKQEAARDVRSTSKPVERSQKAVQDNYETIRQWQKHYRKVFPQYVFYFESIPGDARTRATKQILALGAREEKFFSKAVTHVVTTRQIPPEQPVSNSTDARTVSNAASTEDAGPLRTINPSLLDRTAESQGRTKFALELAGARKPSTSSAHGIFQDVETRSRASNNGDILVKAREMGMKIWALEKLERILNTMFNTDTGEQPPAYNTRNATVHTTKTGRGADLSQLLKNEKVNGPADRDLAVSTKDMAHFRGYYVYVHCMNEKYRPVIMRDYPKPATKEEGKWPQFRLTGPGRCPFVEDLQHIRKLQMQDQQKVTQQRTERSASAAPRTRAASAALEAAKQRTAPKADDRQPLVENNNIARRASATEQSTDTIVSKPLEPPKLIPAKRREPDGIPPLFGSAQASLRAMPRYAGGEPIASGVQPSNITSAIKSQMISSTAAAPGARAGTSKELHQLSRKVLERNSAPNSTTNSTTSSYMTDIRAALNGDRAPPTRAAKRKANETLTGIHEDSEEQEKQSTRRVIVTRRKKPVEKDPKPGYCENCREKFDDFDTHITGRKHRKFATTTDNWTELDNLLSQLERPVL